MWRWPTNKMILFLVSVCFLWLSKLNGGAKHTSDELCTRHFLFSDLILKALSWGLVIPLVLGEGRWLSQGLAGCSRAGIPPPGPSKSQRMAVVRGVWQQNFTYLEASLRWSGKRLEVDQHWLFCLLQWLVDGHFFRVSPTNWYEYVPPRMFTGMMMFIKHKGLTQTAEGPMSEGRRPTRPGRGSIPLPVLRTYRVGLIHYSLSCLSCHVTSNRGDLLREGIWNPATIQSHFWAFWFIYCVLNSGHCWGHNNDSR